MTLVDTSIWVDHFRGRARAKGLSLLLENNEVLVHPWVIGELALGNLGPGGRAVLADLRALPEAPLVRDEEVLDLIAARELSGRGVGWVDAQLLASALVASAELWTVDGKLQGVANALGIASRQES